MANSCAICGFKRSRLASRIFHNLPKDPEVRKQWLKVLKKRETCKQVLVCSKHFITEDYRPFCDKPLLKQGVIPKLNLESNTDEELTENDDKIKLENSMTETDSGILNNISESDSQESLRSDLIDIKEEFIVPTEINESLKRENDSSSDSNTPTNKRCHLNDFGTFRKEDFKDDTLWERFIIALAAFRNEKKLLQRKNARLRKKIQKLKDTVSDLKKKRSNTEDTD